MFVICKYPSLFNSQVAQSLACDIVPNVATLRSCFVVLWNSFKLLELRREVYNRKVPDVYVLYPTAFFSCNVASLCWGLSFLSQPGPFFTFLVAKNGQRCPRINCAPQTMTNFIYCSSFLKGLQVVQLHRLPLVNSQLLQSTLSWCKECLRILRRVDPMEHCSIFLAP